MNRATISMQLLHGSVLAFACALFVSMGPQRVSAQACPCATTQPFGSCVEQKSAYPDSFPGAVLVIPRQGDPSLLYIADLYSGFTYFTDAAKFTTAKLNRFPSPLGSNSTTGLTSREADGKIELVWAIEGKLYASDIVDKANSSVQNVRQLGSVQLDKLAELLRGVTGDSKIQTGSLGGITYHKTRNKFWGVDIENDVYFEFEESGALSLNEGKPIFFFNPKRNKLTGGAYGNSITYVESGGKEYFDIPVGDLASRRPSEVHRVYAVDSPAPDAHQLGESTGAFYTLAQSVGSPKWVTGIAFWPNSCAANQSSEFLLDLDAIGGEPKILQLTSDEPDSATIADFTCVTEAPTEAKLTWRKTKTYTNLQITRKSLTRPAAPAVTVFQNASFDTDPQTFTDKGLLDGTYEYTATVSAKSTVPTVTCRVTLGVGALTTSRPFLGAGNTADPTPFAITAINSADNKTILVADLDSGDAETFDFDLNPKGTLDGPITTGKTVGLAWDSTTNRLYWLEDNNGKQFLYTTEVGGARVGSAVPVDSPRNLTRGSTLAEIAYDSQTKYLWSVDLRNDVAYGITPQGAIPAEFKTAQIAIPESSGLWTGGIAIAALDDRTVTLDFPIGKDANGIADQIGRFQYTRGSFATKKEISRFDLRGPTGAAAVGGIEIVVISASEQYEYVVGVDTRTIYRLALTSPTQNLVAFRRGDVNNDSALNISDPSYLLANLFKGGPAPTCLQAADTDKSGAVDITDAVLLFNYLFKGGIPPLAPFAGCGIDLGSQLTCAAATCVDA